MVGGFWSAAAPVFLVVAAVVGLLDAAGAGTWDLVVLFAAIAAVGVGLVLRSRPRAARFALRPDLARWVVLRAAEGGEEPGSVVDRAVAALREELGPGPGTGAGR